MVMPILFALASQAAFAGDLAQGDVLGTWVGASTCVNLTIAPNCKDETIRYSFSIGKNTAEPVHLVAEKIVGERYQVMYEIDLAFDATGKVWRHDFQSAQGASRWVYRIAGNRLDGEVLQLATRLPMRKVVATRSTH